MKKYIYLLLLLFPVVVSSQTMTQNWITTTNYNVPTADGIHLNTDGGGTVTPENKLVTIQYYDGLGRPIQKILNKQSWSGKNIIYHNAYDEFGIESKKFLPYRSDLDGLEYEPLAATDLLGFYENGDESKTGDPNFEHTTIPFNEDVYEPSTLKRVIERAAMGEDWSVIKGHTIKLDYSSNAENEVLLYNSILTTPEYGVNVHYLDQNGYYARGQLQKVTTYDENWVHDSPYHNDHTSEQFTDKSGRVVLKRNYELDEKIDTYFIYDVYGNLSYVITPKVDTSQTITQDIIDNLCYQYRYDDRNRLVEKKSPEKHWEYIFYDRLSRPVSSGPAVSPIDGVHIGVLVTKYEKFNRIAYTGWQRLDIDDPVVRANYRNSYNDAVYLFEKRENTVVDNITIGYSNQVNPGSIFKLLTVNYYDNYNFPEGPSITDKVNGLPTGKWTRVLTGNTPIDREISYMLYDERFKPSYSYTLNHNGGFCGKSTTFDFSGNVIQTENTYKRTSSSEKITVVEDYNFSPRNLLLSHVHHLAGSAEVLCNNTFSELGKLIVKKVGGEDISAATYYQKIDYTYNIRGWLKGINNIRDLESNGEEDLFAFMINYQGNDFDEGDGAYNVAKQYNGNISETYWRTANDNVLRKYSNEYDGLNRLSSAVY